MDRRAQIEKRLDQIVSLWLKVKDHEREELLLERVRLSDELEKIKGEVAHSA